MPYKLLLADDSVTIQRVIELTFADEDVEVLAVGDGQQAIAKVESERPDIVLADIGMPERDGYEVAAFVKRHPDFQHIPVLLLTGAFEPVDEARAKEVGCDGVLVKPFEPQMVINRVKDLLAGRRPAGLWATGPAAQTPLRQPAPPGADFDLRPTAPPETRGGSLEDYFDRLDAAFASLDGGHAQARPEPHLNEPSIAQPAAGGPRAASEAASAGPEAIRAPKSGERGPATDDLAGWDPDLTADPAGLGASVGSPPILISRPESEPSSGWNAAPRAAQPVSISVEGPGPSPEDGRPATAAATNAPAFPVGPLPSLADAFLALLAAEQGQPPPALSSRPNAISDETVEEIVRRVISRISDQAVRDTVVDVAERLVREEIERIKATP